MAEPDQTSCLTPHDFALIHDIYDPEKQIACEVYDFLMRIDDKPAVEKIMAETKTNDNLFNMAAKAKNLRDSLLKDIDKIAG